jgi:hypothetical protein
MARNFGSRLQRIGDLIHANASKIIREAAMAATNEVVLRTPVKTGRARINWKVSGKTPKATVKEGPDTPNVKTNREVASAEALINASNAIKGWKVGKGNIFIANAVHYIGDLDGGTSAQARAGMTDFGVAAARAVLRKGRLLRGR